MTHVLGLSGGYKAQGAHQLWVVGTLQYATLRFNSFQSWNAKVISKDTEMRALKGRLQVHGILGSDWSGDSMAGSLSTSTNKAGVRQSSNFGYGRSSGTEANATTQRQRLLKYPDAAKDYFFCHQCPYPVTGDKPRTGKESL